MWFAFIKIKASTFNKLVQMHGWSIFITTCYFHIRYKTLMPAIEITTTRSSMVVRCYDFKEDVEKKNRLAENSRGETFRKLIIDFF